MAPLLHLGMVLVGVPYSVQELFTTQGGGSPYGPGHIAGGDNKRESHYGESPLPDDQMRTLVAFVIGRMVVKYHIDHSGSL